MIGIGAALDFLGGAQPRAPIWMRERGLEWMYQLLKEPKRLAHRYVRHNPRFLYLCLSQALPARRED